MSFRYKYKYLACTLFLLLFSCKMAAQVLNPYSTEDGKWGYADENGKVIIMPEYDDVEPFVGEVSVVRKGDLWAFIDKKGNYRGKGLAYGYISTFGENMVYKVFAEGKWGFADGMGNEVISPSFDAVSPIHNDVAIIKKGAHKGIINSKGTILLSPEYEEMELGKYIIYGRKYGKSGGTVGMMDYQGNTVIPEGKVQSAYPPSDGISLCMVWERDNKNLSWALYNVDTKKLTPLPSKQGILYSNFQNGFSLVKESPKLAYFIDRNGKKCTDDYEWIGERKEGYYVVKHNGKYGVIDSLMQVKVPYNYDEGGITVSEGLWNAMRDEEWGFLNMEGNETIPFKYEFTQPFINGHAYVGLLQLEGVRFGLIDHAGSLVVPIQYANINYTLDTNGEMNAVWVANDSLYSRYDMKTKQITYTPGFGFVTFDTSGHSIVRSGSVWGVIDTEGRIKIPVRIGSEKLVRAMLDKVYLMKDRKITEGDIYRMSVCENKERNMKMLTDRIPESLWDY